MKYIYLVILLSFSFLHPIYAVSQFQKRLIAVPKAGIAAVGVYYALDHCLEGCNNTYYALRNFSFRNLDSLKKLIKSGTLAGGMAYTAFVLGAYACNQANIVFNDQ